MTTQDQQATTQQQADEMALNQLRDQFAMHIMQSFISTKSFAVHNGKDLAKSAYEMAEYMIDARAEHKDFIIKKAEFEAQQKQMQADIISKLAR